MTYANFQQYSGMWKENKMDGKGVYKWPDGRKYEGNWVDDKKHGQGTFHWPDGRRYDGQWKDGKQHGEGVMITAKGVKRGLWADGKRTSWIDE